MLDQLPERPDSQIFIYQIDENDFITYVSDNWNQFAYDNDAATLPQITHGLCPECYQAVVTELNRYKFTCGDKICHLE